MRGEAEVRAFSRAMLQKLQEREHHGSWLQHSPAFLIGWLDSEVDELARDVHNLAPCAQILLEAADVANLAMMIADRCGALPVNAPNSVHETINESNAYQGIGSDTNEAVKPNLKEYDPTTVQVGGDHYRTMAITPTQYIVANNIPWLEANAIKYISRHRSKGGVEDIDKAIHYLELLKNGIK